MQSDDEIATTNNAARKAFRIAIPAFFIRSGARTAEDFDNEDVDKAQAAEYRKVFERDLKAFDSVDFRLSRADRHLVDKTRQLRAALCKKR